MSLTKLLTDKLGDLAWAAVKPTVEANVKELLKQRKIRRAVENAVDQVIEELERFLNDEVRSESQRELVAILAAQELTPLVVEPSRLFRGSLDGQKIFEQLYPAQENYPQAIKDEQLGQVWALFVPRVATLLCTFALTIEEWRNEGWQEGFRRLDEVARRLADLQSSFDAMVRQPRDRIDRLYEEARRIRRQRRELSTDITGLGGDSPAATSLEAMFVHPAFELESQAPRRSLQNAADAQATFLAPHARNVIFAPGGAGKTTWSRWIQRHVEQPDKHALVVLIELRQRTQPYPSIHDILRSEAGTHLRDELDADTLRRWLNAGWVQILVDGLDELTQERREAALEWLLGLSEAVGASSIVVTSRPLTTDHLDRLIRAGWQSWSLQAFNRDRICEYIQRWYSHAPLLADAERAVDADQLAEEWDNDATLRALTGNPLLLSTLLTVHHLDGKLPAGRARLYQRYVEGMLGTWDARRKIEASLLPFDATQKRRLLRDVAIQMFLFGSDALSDDGILDQAKRSLRNSGASVEASSALAEIRERSGLLIGPGIWSFAHKTIGEFLVAEAIVEGNISVESGGRLDRMWLYSRRKEDRLNTVFFLWSGLVPMIDLEVMIGQLIDGDFEDQLLGFGLCLDQFSRLSPEFRRRVALVLAKVPRNSVEGTSWWLPFELPKIPTGQWALRGLGQQRNTGNLIYQLERSGDLQWKDVENTQGAAYDYLWVFGQSVPPESPPPNSAPEYAWRLFAVHSMLRHFRPSFSSMLEQLKEVYSYLGDYHLLSHGGLLLVFAAAEAAIREWPVGDHLTILALFEHVPMNKRWLSASADVAVFSGREWHQIDCLGTLSEFLDAFTGERGAQLPDGTLESCRRLCARLWEERGQMSGGSTVSPATAPRAPAQRDTPPDFD